MFRLPVLIFAFTLSSLAAAQDLVGKMGNIELRISELKTIVDAQPLIERARDQIAGGLIWEIWRSRRPAIPPRRN